MIIKILNTQKLCVEKNIIFWNIIFDKMYIILVIPDIKFFRNILEIKGIFRKIMTESRIPKRFGI